VDLALWVPTLVPFTLFYISNANASLIAPQHLPHLYAHFPIGRPFDAPLCLCAHPRLPLLHRTAAHLVIEAPRPHPIVYLCLQPCVLFHISSSLPSLYFISSIIISLIPIEHCLRNPKLLSHSLDEGLRCWDALKLPRFFTHRTERPLETACARSWT